MTQISSQDGSELDVGISDQIEQFAGLLAQRYTATKEASELLNINTALSILSIAAASNNPSSAEKLLSHAKRVSRRQIIPVK